MREFDNNSHPIFNNIYNYFQSFLTEVETTKVKMFFSLFSVGSNYRRRVIRSGFIAFSLTNVGTNYNGTHG